MNARLPVVVDVGCSIWHDTSSQTSRFMVPNSKDSIPNVQTPSPQSTRSGDSWQLQTAKARFSEVFRRARIEGPQRITRGGKEGVVILAEEQYDRLVGKSHQPRSLVQFFRQSPLVGVELDLERDRDPGRDLESPIETDLES
jgi:antitoxin Phd